MSTAKKSALGCDCDTCGSVTCPGAPAFKGICPNKPPKATFPNNPTWEQKCRTAWDENKRLEAERLANARQIFDLNSRLGINDTNESRLVELRVELRERGNLLSVARKDLDAARLEAKALRLTVEKNTAEAIGLADKLSAAHARIDELLATEPGCDSDDEYEDVPGVFIEDEVDALTDLIRAAKKIRKRWRAGVE